MAPMPRMPRQWLQCLPSPQIVPTTGAIGALMNKVQQPRTLPVLGLNAGMITAAGADELVEILTDVKHPIGTKAHPLLLSTSLTPRLSPDPPLGTASLGVHTGVPRSQETPHC